MEAGDRIEISIAIDPVPRQYMVYAKSYFGIDLPVPQVHSGRNPVQQFPIFVRLEIKVFAGDPVDVAGVLRGGSGQCHAAPYPGIQEKPGGASRPGGIGRDHEMAVGYAIVGVTKRDIHLKTNGHDTPVSEVGTELSKCTWIGKSRARAFRKTQHDQGPIQAAYPAARMEIP
jgi:hypothetical protein